MLRRVEEAFLGCVNVLFLDLDADYIGAFNL